jgi:predicted Zn-ribbon and HTH transcriptional regulator
MKVLKKFRCGYCGFEWKTYTWGFEKCPKCKSLNYIPLKVLGEK